MHKFVYRLMAFLLLLNFLAACNVSSALDGDASSLPSITPEARAAGPTAVQPGPTQAASAGPTPGAGDLPDGAKVQRMMQTAHLHWRTVWGDTLGISYSGDGSTEPHAGSRMQVWVQQPTLARALIGPLDGRPEQMWLSDGSQFRDVNGDLQPFPEYVTNLAPPPDASGGAPVQPPGLLLGIPLGDLIFPVGLASRPGTYRVAGRESIAGRDAYVVEWRPPDGPVIDRFWVDTVTGIILRWQNFRKPDGASITGDTHFTRIMIDVAIPEGAFSLDRSLPADFASSYTDMP